MDLSSIIDILRGGQWVGWVATGLFSLSYVVKRELHLLLLQALAGTLWLAYAVLIGAMPLLIANAVVTGGALYKAQKLWRGAQKTLRGITSE